MRYAKTTTVSPERSRMQIEKVLMNYGASGFAYMNRADKAMIAFVMNERQVIFKLPLPVEIDYRTKKQYEQAERQRWRALLLSIKSKLETVESGITSFEQEFMAHFTVRGDVTVGEKVLEQINRGEIVLALPSA